MESAAGEKQHHSASFARKSRAPEPFRGKPSPGQSPDWSTPICAMPVSSARLIGALAGATFVREIVYWLLRERDDRTGARAPRDDTTLA